MSDRFVRASLKQTIESATARPPLLKIEQQRLQGIIPAGVFIFLIFGLGGVAVRLPYAFREAPQSATESFCAGNNSI